MSSRQPSPRELRSAESVTADEFMAAYKRGSTLPPLEIDPRIDLTKPIYEQAMKLLAKDRAAEEKLEKRKRQSNAA